MYLKKYPPRLARTLSEEGLKEERGGYGNRPDPRDAHQVLRLVVLERTLTESRLQLPDLRVETGNLLEQNPA